MLKRLFKIVAVLITTGGLSLLAPAIARADTTPGSTNSSETVNTVDVTSSSDTTVVVKNDSSNDPTAGPSDSAQPPASDNTATSDKSTITPVASTTPPADTATTSSDTSKATPVAPADSNQPPTETTHERIVQLLNSPAAAQTTKLSSSATYSAPVAVTGPADPGQPPAPASRPVPPAQGALSGINGVLAATVVPQMARLFGGFAGRDGSLPIAPAMLTVTLVVIMLIVGSGFIDFLRRAGFHSAARGDGPVPFSIFATPLKVDANWAHKPSYTPTFYGVRNKNLSKVAQCF